LPVCWARRWTARATLAMACTCDALLFRLLMQFVRVGHPCACIHRFASCARYSRCASHPPMPVLTTAVWASWRSSCRCIPSHPIRSRSMRATNPMAMLSSYQLPRGFELPPATPSATILFSMHGAATLDHRSDADTTGADGPYESSGASSPMPHSPGDLHDPTVRIPPVWVPFGRIPPGRIARTKKGFVALERHLAA
jgi:hypothetical protein